MTPLGKIISILVLYTTIILFILKWFSIINSWVWVFLPAILYISVDLILSIVILIIAISSRNKL